MGERELRRRCRRLLQQLGIRPPLDVVELCRRIGQRRGRPAALIGCATDESQLSLLGDASVCHGWAGLVHCARRAADDGDNDALASHVSDLQRRMKQHLDTPPESQSDGLLEGMAGVKLVQHAVPGAKPPISRWDACLLIDG